MDNHQKKIISVAGWEEIWNKFKSGDKEAFELIYNEHVDFLFSYGTKVTVNTELVEDAIQDLFLYLLSHRDHITTPHFIRYYLLKAFKRILLGKIKLERFYVTPDNGGPYNFDFSVVIDETVETELREKKLELVEALIGQLDSQKREVLFLKFHSGLSYAEIADIVGIKASSVKKLVYRTIFSFREILNGISLELFFLFSKKIR
ncbi:MAG: sigma-70 family RNA polymerase sigma factor [Prolixibacteraceae bacterium]